MLNKVHFKKSNFFFILSLVFFSLSAIELKAEMNDDVERPRRGFFESLFSGFSRNSTANSEKRFEHNSQSSNVHASLVEKAKKLAMQTSNLDEDVLKLALQAQSCAKAAGVTKSDVLTVIDFSKPSTKTRLWVFDVNREKSLFETFVAHGKNSGEVYPTAFSDRPNSKQSSIGIYTTGGMYNGSNGASLKLHGKEPGFNSHAFSRGIVVHGASYVGEDVVRTHGSLGRSFGCPAVSHDLAQPIMQKIKDGSLLFAYYPDSHWLKKSKFLNCGIK